jgi:hypothetical protein
MGGGRKIEATASAIIKAAKRLPVANAQFARIAFRAGDRTARPDEDETFLLDAGLTCTFLVSLQH